MAPPHRCTRKPKRQPAAATEALEAEQSLVKSTQSIGFLDLPAEVRGIIYDYVFHLAVLLVEEHGINEEESVGHCSILRTSRAICDEATPHLFTQARQVFCYYAKDSEKFPQINLRPLWLLLVPSMEVMCDQPNFVRLDMGALKTYISLRELILGTFAFLPLGETPHPLINFDEFGDHTLNEANDEFMVASAKEALLDKEEYRYLHAKPITFQGLKCILSSKYRKFRVILECKLIFSNDVDEGDGCMVRRSELFDA